MFVFVCKGQLSPAGLLHSVLFTHNKQKIQYEIYIVRRCSPGIITLPECFQKQCEIFHYGLLTLSDTYKLITICSKALHRHNTNITNATFCNHDFVFVHFDT